MLTDALSLFTRLVVAVEKLAEAQTLIATEDGPVPVERTRAPEIDTPEEAPATKPEEAPATKPKEIGPEEVRSALAAVLQSKGKSSAAEVLKGFKGTDGKPVKKVSHIPSESLTAVYEALMKEVG